MASVNQTRPHCVNQMGKTHSKPLAARHGRGMAWAWHGHGMLCVNRPLDCPVSSGCFYRLLTDSTKTWSADREEVRNFYCSTNWMKDFGWKVQEPNERS